MNIENCIKRASEGKRNIPIMIKVSEPVSQWLREKKLSPTGIFHEALRELGCSHLNKDSENISEAK